MTKLAQVIDAIRETAAEMGLPAFARSAGLPYQTVIHWKNFNFRPHVVTETLEKMADAAERHHSAKLNADAPESETAA